MSDIQKILEDELSDEEILELSKVHIPDSPPTVMSEAMAVALHNARKHRKQRLEETE